MDSFEFDGKRIIRSGSDLFFKTHLCGERWDDLKKPTDTFLKECIRALLARDAALAALFREVITLSREINYCSRNPIEHGEYDEKIDAIEARARELGV